MYTGVACSSMGEIDPTTCGAESTTAVVEHRGFTKPVVSMVYAGGNCRLGEEVVTGGAGVAQVTFRSLEHALHN